MAIVWCRPCCFENMPCCDSTMAFVWILAGCVWECVFVWKLFILIPVCRDPSYTRVWMHCGVIWLLCVCFQSDRTIVWVFVCVHQVVCRREWFFFCLNAPVWAVYIFPGVYVVPTRLHPYVIVTWMHQVNGICLGVGLQFHCTHLYFFRRCTGVYYARLLWECPVWWFELGKLAIYNLLYFHLLKQFGFYQIVLWMCMW